MTSKRLATLCITPALLLAGGGDVRAADAPLVLPFVRPGTVIRVEAFCPGATAQVVADTVAIPIEMQVTSVEGCIHLFSRCTDDGKYVLQVTFSQRTAPAEARSLVHDQVALALPTLPEAVQRAGVTVKKNSAGPALFLTLFSPDGRYDDIYLSNYASICIKEELSRIPGVGEVRLIGDSDFGLSVRLDPDRLAAFGLSVGDVVKTLREQTAGHGTGVGLAGADLIGDTVLKADSDGRTIRLRDLARLERAAGLSSQFARIDGKPAAALVVFPAPNSRAREVSSLVRDATERLKSNFPEGVDYKLLFDLTAADAAGTDPTNASDYLLTELRLPDNDSVQRTLDLVSRCDAVLMKTPGVQHVLSLGDNPFGRFRGGPCALIKLDEESKRTGRERVAQTIRRGLSNEVDDVDARQRFLARAGAAPAGYPVDFCVRGPDAADVRELGTAIVQRLSRTRKLTDALSVPGDETVRRDEFVVDRTVATTCGVSAADIDDALRLVSGPISLGSLTPGRTSPIQLLLGLPDKDPEATFNHLRVRNTAGQMIPLSRFATVRRARSPESLDSLDFEPAVEITANPAPGVSLAEARGACETAARAAIRELGLSAGYQIAWMRELPESKPPPDEEKAEVPEADRPKVFVARPLAREVADYLETAGRVEAVSTVEIRARVSGYLTGAMFKEGADVQQGDLLFEIDPRPYQAKLDQALGQIELYQASLKLARATAARNEAAAKAVPGSVGQQELDQSRAAVEEAEARLKVARATVEVYKLDVAFTRVTAPISGRIGRRLVDPGNLVTVDTTALATLVSVNPMYVYFDLDERTLLQLRRMNKSAPAAGKSAVYVGLADEQGFPHQGVLDFADNRIDPATGTLRVRAVLPNPQILPDRQRLLSPGMFVRARLPLAEAHKALLLPEEAIGSDAGLKFVYVVNEEGKTIYRRVQTGALQDGLRVIVEGITPEERVVVGKMRRVRPGQIVRPQEVPVQPSKP
jgi:multidrug efflux system membrane fusion protein